MNVPSIDRILSGNDFTKEAIRAAFREIKEALAGHRRIDAIRFADGTSQSTTANSVGANELKKDYTKTTFDVAADNLDGYTQIAAGQRLVLRFNLGANGGIALVGLRAAGFGENVAYKLSSIDTSPSVGVVTGGIAHMITEYYEGGVTLYPHVIVVNDYTRAMRTTKRQGYEQGHVVPAQRGETYTDTAGLMFGWYFDLSGLFTIVANSKSTIESAWIDGTELKIAMRCDAVSGSYTLGGAVIAVY